MCRHLEPASISLCLLFDCTWSNLSIRRQPPFPQRASNSISIYDVEASTGRLLERVSIPCAGLDANELVIDAAGLRIDFNRQRLTDPAQSADSAEPQVPAPIASNDVYQIILEQGARVSIVPESVDAEELKGTHPQLGECSLPWSSVVRISLGDAIAVDASQNRYGKWKLQHAPDPKFVSESEGGNDRPNDTPQMRMIGQGAPEFDLMRIDGTPFKLKENRGKILIVDFWATWCGPCIRSIPSLIEISKEYKEAGVELVLVNCEEPETRVRPFLERLKSIPTVVLDTDGTVSKQYNVAAIPQTVLIDRDGGIVEVLVGASDENEEILRKKIETLIKQ